MAAPRLSESPARVRDVRARRPALSGELLFGSFRRGCSVAALLAIDVTGVALGVYLALVTKQVYNGNSPFPGILWMAERSYLPFIVLVVALVFAKNGLYRSRESRPTGAKIVSSLAFSTLLVALFALATGHHFNSYAAFVVGFVYASILILILRASYDSITLTAMRALGIRRRTLLAGDAGDLADLYAALRAFRRGPDMELVGAVTLDGSPAPLTTRTLGSVAELSDLVAEVQPHDLVMGGIDLSDEDLLNLVERCREQRTRLRVVPSTAELLLEQGTFIPGQALPLLEVRPPMITGVDWAVKRTFDLVVSALLLVLLSPVLLVISLLVAVTSRGGVIYRDRRIGVGEREFAMLKFRSMYADAAERQETLETENEAGGAIFKIRRDPRVTPVGRVLRRLSLDELPQLVNVLRGDMSLVGPRPLPLRDYELLEDWHRRRSHVLPGITGLWQTSGRSSLSFEDLVRLDFYYLENWSIWLDVAILLRTPFVVLTGRGAY
jgi:exopolysaccharide biosynthesis polyprenyl glycosylphosphotransferase